jgi:hypothetical protein
MKNVNKYPMIMGIVVLLVQVSLCPAAWVLSNSDADDGNSSDGPQSYIGDMFQYDWKFSCSCSSSFGSSGMSTSGYCEAWTHAISYYSNGYGGSTANTSVSGLGGASATWTWDGAPGTSPQTTISCQVEASGTVGADGLVEASDGASAYSSSCAAGVASAWGTGLSASATGYVYGSVSSGSKGHMGGDGLTEEIDNDVNGWSGGYGGQFGAEVEADDSYVLSAGAGTFWASTSIYAYSTSYATTSGGAMAASTAESSSSASCNAHAEVSF